MANVNKSLHRTISDIILGYQVIIDEVDDDKFTRFYDDCSINHERKEITVQICKDEINWIKFGKLNFAARCFIDVENIVTGLNLKGYTIDAYGSIIVDDELLLNNYDGGFCEADKSDTGFVNVLGYSTVNKNGAVRFSQIVYSFKFNRLLIRDDVSYQLPFKVDLKEDFGGKRATYRSGSILSLRTTLAVYDKVPERYKQSKSRKNDLSYPRLQLS